MCKSLEKVSDANVADNSGYRGVTEILSSRRGQCSDGAQRPLDLYQFVNRGGFAGRVSLCSNMGPGQHPIYPPTTLETLLEPALLEESEERGGGNFTAVMPSSLKLAS